MAVLKSATFQPVAKEAVVLDLGDIGAQAQKIIAAAEHRAVRLEAEARQRAEAAAQEAANQACEKARADGLAAGLEEGRKTGREEAFNEMTQRLGALEIGLLEVAQQLQTTRQALEREARYAVLELAMRLAERIVHRAIETDRSVVVDQVAAALDHVLGRYDVSLAIHPDDAPLVAEALPDLTRSMPDLQNVQLVEDETIRVGGCVVRYGEGEVDATIDTQLRRIVELLLPGADAPDDPPAESKPS